MSEAEAPNAAKEVSFYARVKAELRKLFVHVPGWEASAAATLTYIAPTVEAVLTVVDPEAAPLVAALVAKIQSAMAAAAVVIKAAGPTTTLATYLQAINSDAAQILSAAGVKDPALTARLTSLVSLITSEVSAILAELGDTKEVGTA